MMFKFVLWDMDRAREIARFERASDALRVAKDREIVRPLKEFAK